MATVIPLRSMVGDYGAAKRNVPLEVDDETAKKLVKNGLAVYPGGVVEAADKGADAGAKPEEKAKRAKASKTVVKAAPSGVQNPLDAPRPDGGQTGADLLSSVSAGGQAPEAPISTTSGDQAQS